MRSAPAFGFLPAAPPGSYGPVPLPLPTAPRRFGRCVWGRPGEEAGHVGAATAAAAAPPAVPAIAAAASWAESACGPGRARCLPPARLLPASAAAVAVLGSPPRAAMATRSCREKAQKLNEQHQLILSKLLREEDNKYCADCEAKGSADVAAPGWGLLRPVTFPSPRRPGPERTPPRLRPAGSGPDGRAGAGFKSTLISARGGGWIRPAVAVVGASLFHPVPGFSRCPNRDARTLRRRAGAEAALEAQNRAPAWAVLGVKVFPFSRLSSQVHPWGGGP